MKAEAFEARYLGIGVSGARLDIVKRVRESEVGELRGGTSKSIYHGAQFNTFCTTLYVRECSAVMQDTGREPDSLCTADRPLDRSNWAAADGVVSAQDASQPV